MKRQLRWVLAVVALGLGCADRTHLSSTFGQANRRAFRAQVIDPNAGKVNKPDPGLDPEEAAEVAATYRKSISSKKDGKAAAGPQILVLDPAAVRPPGMSGEAK